MSQGKKEVRVVDCDSGLTKGVAVDEARWNQILTGLQRCFKSWDHPYALASDSQEGMAFLASQLAYTEAEVYYRDYQDVQFRELLPVTAEAGPDADTVRYQIMDKVGQGKRVQGNAKDIPYADVAASTVEIGVVSGGAGYRYSQDELLKAARMVRPLPAERMATAVEMFERHINQVAMLGESAASTGQAKLEGLLNYTGVTTATGGAGGYNGDWGGASTVDEVLADVNKAILAYWTASGYTRLPDTFAMAPACFSALSTRYNSLGTKTLLQLIQESNIATARTGKPLNCVPVLQGATAGGSSATRCVLYRNEKQHLVLHVPMPIRFLAPQPDGLDVSIPGWYKYAGLNIRRLYTVMYLDGMD